MLRLARTKYVLLMGAALVSIAPLAGCGSSHGAPAAESASSAPSQPAVTPSCNDGTPSGAPPNATMALLIFPAGTSAARLLSASQKLALSFYGHEQADLASGFDGVVGFVCSPPAVRVFYQSNLDGAQLNALKSQLLSESGATSIDLRG
jgi:hypothetical protein